MQILSEQTIVRLLREEWEKRLKSFLLKEDDNLPIKARGIDKILSQGLKLVHKNSKLRYTIDSIGAREVVLKNPEGDNFIVDVDTLESEYSID